MADWLPLVLVGFVAQMVDGALGMAFGLISTSAMLAMSIPLAQASAAVHTAEVFTTAAAGTAHLRMGNVDRRLLLVLGMSGAVGGMVGAYVLSNIDGKAIRPFVIAYLFLMGGLILFRLWRTIPPVEARPVFVAPLGLVGGFLDAIGGGGWGPIVTSTLLGSGQAPRMVLGTVALSEFFVTLATTATFFTHLGIVHIELLLALVAGGIIAAPFGSIIAKHVKPHVLMIAVGCLICALALIDTARMLKLFG
ncbi:MAG: sulfite exporter TauE/SafE family protein [Beijerinckiaceae bacterium]